MIEGAVITFSDITETKKARQMLHESATLRRLAVVVTDSRDAILVQDLDGRIPCWNPGATQMYGWSEAEALTMNVRALLPQAGRDEALAVVRQLCRAEVVQPYAAERIARDGRIVRVSLTATALVDASGAIYAVATTERAGA